MLIGFRNEEEEGKTKYKESTRSKLNDYQQSENTEEEAERDEKENKGEKNRARRKARKARFHLKIKKNG